MMCAVARQRLFLFLFGAGLRCCEGYWVGLRIAGVAVLGLRIVDKVVG